MIVSLSQGLVGLVTLSCVTWYPGVPACTSSSIATLAAGSQGNRSVSDSVMPTWKSVSGKFFHMFHGLSVESVWHPGLEFGDPSDPVAALKVALRLVTKLLVTKPYDQGFWPRLGLWVQFGSPSQHTRQKEALSS
eukprot:6487208-Amphidinium_carterae.2